MADLYALGQSLRQMLHRITAVKRAKGGRLPHSAFIISANRMAARAAFLGDLLAASQIALLRCDASDRQAEEAGQPGETARLQGAFPFIRKGFGAIIYVSAAATSAFLLTLLALFGRGLEILIGKHPLIGVARPAV